MRRSSIGRVQRAALSIVVVDAIGEVMGCKLRVAMGGTIYASPTGLIDLDLPHKRRTEQSHAIQHQRCDVEVDTHDDAEISGRR